MNIKHILLIWILICVTAMGALESQMWERIKEGSTIGWAVWYTGQDANDLTSYDKFKSVARIHSDSNAPGGDLRHDDEIWVVVDRTIDSNTVTFIEQFTPLDWGDDADYCWFVDCGGGDRKVWIPEVPEVPAVPGETCYPYLVNCEDSDGPTAPADTPLSGASAVSNASELMAITGSNHYYLTGNINLSGVTWTPIADFAGILDGNDFTISNLTISAAYSIDGTGLFQNLSSGAQIRDLTLSGFDITTVSYFGCLAGRISSNVLVRNVNVENSTLTSSSDNYRVGSVVGYCAGSGTHFVDCSVTNCSYETAAGTGEEVGGFVGYAANSEYIDCSVDGMTINDVDTRTGGFVGVCPTGSTFIGCTVSSLSMTVNPPYEYPYAYPLYIGGFAGYCHHAILNSSASGTIDITSATHVGSIGGLSGDGNGPYIGNCYSDVDITITLSGSTNYVYRVGGIIGTVAGSSGFWVTCSYSLGSITIDNQNDAMVSSIGGAIGELSWSSPVNFCYSDSDITITNSSFYLQELGFQPGVGGFIGYYGAGPSTSLTRCYATNSLTDLSGTSKYFGGLFGYGNDQGAADNITECYATGGEGITAGENTGGLVGYLEDETDYIFNNCFWDTETSGLETSTGGTGLTTAEIQSQDVLEFYDWDFDTYWELEACTTEEVPAVPAVPGYWDTLYGYIPNELCVYADGVSLGTFDVNESDANDIIGIDEDAYDVIIAGINYYSIYESFPLVASEIARNQRTVTQRVALDLYQTKGVNLGTSMAYSSPIEFADANDLYTGFKIAEFPRGTFREPVIYLWEWLPYPWSLRGAYMRESIIIPE